MMNNREYIGKRIAEIRHTKGLSIRQLAEACGVNFANIYKIENGKYNVSIDILGKICDALDCKIDVICKAAE
jgi:transcriptional regulator with XRE-family HTH domain